MGLGGTGNRTIDVPNPGDPRESGSSVGGANGGADGRVREGAGGVGSGSLRDILARHPIERLELDVDELMSYGGIATGELLDIADVLNIPYDRLGAAMRGASGPDKARIGLAFAWVILRRENPALTWAEMGRRYVLAPPSRPAEPDIPGPASRGPEMSS